MIKNKNIGMLAMLTVLGSVILSTQVFAYNTINSQLDLGERNADVTSLQGFFSDNASIYPEKLITGYFGGLTRSAVLRFQAQYGLDQVGRVGPMTRDKLNSLISQGGWVVSDIAGPWIYSVGQSIGNTSATFSWSTNEMASAKVFYNTGTVTMNEGDINSVGFGQTNGWVAMNDNVARTSQQVTINGLLPNTTYHYVIVSTDPSGNVSVWNPNTTFTTGY
jgi:peptidoglycan hydrolase-like protein with peptidoglycan-binding domain